MGDQEIPDEAKPDEVSSDDEEIPEQSAHAMLDAPSDSEREAEINDEINGGSTNMEVGKEEGEISEPEKGPVKVPSANFEEKEEGEISDTESGPPEDPPAIIVMEIVEQVVIQQQQPAAVPQQAPVVNQHVPSIPNMLNNLSSPPISWERCKSTINSFRCDVPQAIFKFPSLASPPPALPAMFGTVLFPALHPLLNQCPSKVLSTISRNYRSGEIAAFECTRAKNCYAHLHKTERKGRPFCVTCSEWRGRPTPIWHRHFSSKQNRLEALPNELHKFNCDQCQVSPHYFLSGGRNPLLLTSSALHNHWGHGVIWPFVGDKIHCDVVSIPGAKLRDLTRAFKAEFENHIIPVDALVVAGVNNVLSCPVFDQYMDNLEAVEDLLPTIKTEVVAASRRLKEEAVELVKAVLAASPPKQTNSAAFSTLPIPPCLTWPSPLISKSARGANIIRALKLEMLTQLNLDLQELNNLVKVNTGIDTVRAPSFRSWGLKRIKSQTVGPPSIQEAALGPFSHRLDQFRERRWEHKLHLVAPQKLKMAHACHSYFKALYKPV